MCLDSISIQRVQWLFRVVISNNLKTPGFMVYNATCNNISFASWRSVLLLEEIEVPGENHRPVASHCQTLLHNVVSSTPRHEPGSNSQL